MTETEKVTAPFTEEQVRNLNAFQFTMNLHPFTCGTNSRHNGGRLIARTEGWFCPDCDHTQDWAHAAMADGSWAKAAERTTMIMFGKKTEKERREYYLAHKDDLDEWGESTKGNPDDDQGDGI